MQWAHLGLVVGALSWPSVVLAQQVNIAFDLNTTAASSLGLDVDALERDLRKEVENELKLDDIGSFTESMAEANAMASKGIGVDYSSNFGAAVVGGAFGSGVHDVGVTFGNGDELLPEGGFAATVSLMGGINLGGLTGAKKKSFSRRIRLFANGLYMPMPSGAPFGGEMYNFGGHLQIKLIQGPKSKVVEWGGFDLTSGYARSFYRLELGQDLPITIPGDVTMKWTASGDYTIEATNDAIPIELSSNLRVAILTGYLGAAFDINRGVATSDASLGGGVKAEGQRLGSVDVDVKASGDASEYVPRVFVGAQGRLAMLVAYGQLNVGFNNAFGGHIGGRLVF